MSVVTIVHALFPHTDMRPAPRRRSGGRLSHLLAIGFALVPLAVMGQVFAHAV